MLIFSFLEAKLKDLVYVCSEIESSHFVTKYLLQNVISFVVKQGQLQSACFCLKTRSVAVFILSAIIVEYKNVSITKSSNYGSILLFLQA